ncbi:MAG TPA: DUF1028 domain-containing protein [Vicinamibacterales bacterium]|jgi:uncharacterized Ntn-hydrolase superfamily protein
MTRVALLTTVFILTAHTAAYATWSVIAVDRDRGVVVIASATCVQQASLEKFPAKDLRDIQAIVVPGIGVAAAQAGVDATRANQRLIFAELQKGTAPDQILELLKQDPAIERRQFGIVDMQGRMAGFSGTRNQPVSLDRHGQVPGTEIYYSIQGNILTNEAVVTDAVNALVSARGDLTDRVMAAMEAADAKGGDNRCSCEKGPQLKAPCTTKTAHVAYILRADKGDRNGDSFNDGTYAMYISVTDSDITAAEDANPVKTLRMRYDTWKSARK